jgi:hypothetical protein
MLGHGPHNFEMRCILKIAGAISDERVSSPEYHYRTFRIKRVCHCGQTARDARSGCQRRHTRLAPQPRQRICGVYGSLLMTKINNCQIGEARSVIERRDVAPGQSEEVSNPKLFNLANYQIAAVQPG